MLLKTKGRSSQHSFRLLRVSREQIETRTLTVLEAKASKQGHASTELRTPLPVGCAAASQRQVSERRPVPVN